ncbi:MAG TPA: PAS domain S-box protein [Chitinophagales bacterium]|nr:PAS domain S-box protein [Chitinophagales bacterium]
MLNFLKEINIKEVRETNLKLIFGLGSVVYAAFGILLHTSAIQYNDPLWLRLIILFIGIASLLVSVYHEPAKKHLVKILFANLYIYNAHLYYLLFVNDFDPNYKLSLLVVTFASILFIQDKKLNKIYLAVNAVTHLSVLIVTNNLNVENISVLFLIFMVLFIGYFTNSERINAFKQIKDRETILHTINNNVYHGIFRINTEDEVIYANENFAKMLGYASLADIHCLKKPFQFTSQETGRQFNVQKMDKKIIKNLEAEIICRGNKTMWVLLSLTPCFGKEGELLYYDGAIIDITDRKFAEKELMLFSAAIDHSTVCVAITDRNGYIRYVNPFFMKVSGYSFDELFRTKIQSYIIHDTASAREMRNEIRAGRVWKGELNHTNKTGKLLTLLTSIAPIRDKRGEIINFVVVSEDITERKAAEQELLAAKELAETANRAQEQFLSTISHELRTPMNAVIGISNLLLEEDPRPDQTENLRILKFSAGNLLAIINDLLDLTKIEAGKLDFVTLDFDLEHTLNDIKKTHSLKANNKSVELLVSVDNNVPKILVGDAYRLSQILNNLVGNAVKFTDKGKVEIKVTASSIKEDIVELNFNIKDTGIGIPADKMVHIFEPFSQASITTNRIYGGTGLGLAITKRLIELQGGKIFVQSEAGKGSSFSFNVSFKKSKKESLPRESEVKHYTGFSGIRILLVEDNKVNQKVATKFLSKWDALVDIAENGAEALQKIKLNSYDIVLMDLLMPVMDGYETTRQIRKMPLCKDLPVIALTASAMSHEREKAFEAEVNDYISKPFVPSELYGKIARYAYRDMDKLNAAA